LLSEIKNSSKKVFDLKSFEVVEIEGEDVVEGSGKESGLFGDT
jgi:hypothetical protein